MQLKGVRERAQAARAGRPACSMPRSSCSHDQRGSLAGGAAGAGAATAAPWLGHMMWCSPAAGLTQPARQRVAKLLGRAAAAVDELAPLLPGCSGGAGCAGRAFQAVRCARQCWDLWEALQ